jgi:hypothetical protein
MTDHDLLVRIDERVQKLDKCITEHLRDHQILGSTNRKSFIMIVVAVIAALGSLLAALAK